MKKFVTGATGFIGSSLVRELLKDGEEVRVMVRHNSDTRNIDGLEVEKVYGDIRDRESVRSSLDGCDVFYQTAGLYSFWEPDNRIFYDVNVEGTKAALDAALQKGIEKVVYTSSIVAVGVGDGEDMADESTEYNLWKYGNHYSRSKYLGELEAKKYCEQGLPVVIVNPAAVIGIRDIRPTPSGQMILSILNGQMPGYMDAGMNFVDVEDVARGHILAAKKGVCGERYILGNENMTLIDFYRLIAEIGNVRAPARKLPLSVAVSFGYMYQLLSKFTGKPPLVTASMAKMSGACAYYDCSKAKTELGMPQTPVRESVGKAIDWYREHGYVKSS